MEGDDLPWGLFSPFQPHLLGELASTQEKPLRKRQAREKEKLGQVLLFLFSFFFSFRFQARTFLACQDCVPVLNAPIKTNFTGAGLNTL